MRAELIKTVETTHGEMFSFFSDDEFIGRALDKAGRYSPQELELLGKLTGPGDVVVEVGANIGAITVPLAKLTGEVLAFEPQAENFSLLQRNIFENLLNNVKLHQLALGSAPGETTMPALAELGHHNFGNVALFSGSQHVKIEPLDAMVRGDVALIKIDAEGGEIEVLEGARATIARCRPVLYVENDRAEKSTALLRLIRSFDYRCFQHHPPIVRADCEAQDNRGRLLCNIASINVLCIPSERLANYAAVTEELKPIVPPSPRLGKTGWAGVARLGGIGDNLIAASVLRPLKAKGYKVDVITCEPHCVVFENNPHIDKISIKGKSDLPSGQAWHDWMRSRGNEYDIFANLSHSCEVSLAMVPAQTQVQWPSAMRRKYYGHNYLEFVHDVLGMPYEFGPLFFSTAEERDQAIVTRKQIGNGPIIGWPLNGSRVDKTYPKIGMAIARLIKELGAQVIACGAPPPYRDFDAAKQIQEYLQHANGSDRGYHLALSPDPDNPSWPIRRILTQLQHCDLIIGPDTGQMWAVAFEAMPKIMLHSHASVTNITKHWINTTSLHADPAEVRCWPCHLLHDTVDTCLEEQRRHGMKPDPGEKGAACIQTISVEAIVNAAKGALA